MTTNPFQGSKRLFLVRHGEVQGSRPGMLLGSTDAHLSEVGRHQASLVGALLPLTELGCVVCSPLARARETAEIALTGQEATVEIDPDLREMDFGEWEGLVYEEVARRYPQLIQDWRGLNLGFAFPQGERLDDFTARIERAAKNLAERDTPAVVAFTHGGVIRVLICYFLGLPLRDYLLFDVATGSVTEMRLWEGRGVLAGLCSPGAALRLGDVAEGGPVPSGGLALGPFPGGPLSGRPPE